MIASSMAHAYVVKNFPAFRERREVFKEVIYPQVPLRIPCYDLAPLMTN